MQIALFTVGYLIVALFVTYVIGGAARLGGPQ